MTIMIRFYRTEDGEKQLRIEFVTPDITKDIGTNEEEEDDGFPGEARFLREKCLAYVSELDFEHIVKNL